MTSYYIYDMFDVAFKSMVTSQIYNNLLHSTYDAKMLIEKVIHVYMLRTNISYFWIEKMFVKPLVEKTQNVKF